jgi:predicted GH43/DUF377 family glycosyl hydrolase
MATVFDAVFSSRSGLGDVGITVDPFTGRMCSYIPAVTRYPGGPVVTRDSFFDSVQGQMVQGRIGTTIAPELTHLKDTFNCGVSHTGDGYVMMVRFQNAARFNHVFLARSTDGIAWTHTPELLDLPNLPAAPAAAGVAGSGLEIPPGKKWHRGVFYDPRITQIEDGSYCVALAVDYDTL